MLDLLDQPFDPADALRQFNTAIGGAGAVVSFTGHVRPQANGAEVKTLFLQAYSPLTENGIEQAIASAKTRWPLSAVRIIHRIGEMQPGATIVFVAAASAHRRAAFEAADFLMDYLKTEAVFWKKEIGAGGSVWIEPRAEDYQDSARWAD